MKFIMHEDHAHAWLEVPAELVDSILADKVSAFSYISDDCKTIYLEEDCDATAFIEKLKENNIEHEIVEKWHDGECFIRSLSHLLFVNDNE
ncbi:hypothetical protein KFE26_17895 [Shewanella sp. M16]|uniref:hypothetical protein n=1 Tax=Shewanella sp. M16 TaxID=2830837 RepID=UPI001BAF9ADF|nr:hypothetical protein [Shewanella sp. M16]MBS0044158.1 hypothetical protein [Shewanella sp. M16]